MAKSKTVTVEITHTGVWYMDKGVQRQYPIGTTLKGVPIDEAGNLPAVFTNKARIAGKKPAAPAEQKPAAPAELAPLPDQTAMAAMSVNDLAQLVAEHGIDVDMSSNDPVTIAAAIAIATAT